jgi:hypothetical protein
MSGNASDMAGAHTRRRSVSLLYRATNLVAVAVIFAHSFPPWERRRGEHAEAGRVPDGVPRVGGEWRGMPTSESGLAAPPVDALLAEMVATLSYAAHAYLAPSEGEPDVASAALACDVAGQIFERATPRLRPDERSALSAMLTELRMTIVRKRG